MVTFAVFLLFFINVNVIDGNNIMFNRPTEQRSYVKEIHATADGSENTIHAATYFDERDRTTWIMSRKQMAELIETDTMSQVDPRMNTRETDPRLGPIRQSDPSDLLRQDLETTKKTRRTKKRRTKPRQRRSRKYHGTHPMTSDTSWLSIGTPTDPDDDDDDDTTSWQNIGTPIDPDGTTRWRRPRRPTDPDATTSWSWLTSMPIDPDATTRWRRKTYTTAAGESPDITYITTPFTVKYLDDNTTAKPWVWTTSQDGNNIMFNRPTEQRSYEKKIDASADGSENTIHASTNSDERDTPTWIISEKQMAVLIETDTMAQVDPRMNTRETDPRLGPTRQSDPSDQLRQDLENNSTTTKKTRRTKKRRTKPRRRRSRKHHGTHPMTSDTTSWQGIGTPPDPDHTTINVIYGINIMFNRSTEQIKSEKKINATADGSENTIHAASNSDEQDRTTWIISRKQMAELIETNTMSQVDPRMNTKETDPRLGPIRQSDPSDQLRQDLETTKKTRRTKKRRTKPRRRRSRKHHGTHPMTSYTTSWHGIGTPPDPDHTTSSQNIGPPADYDDDDDNDKSWQNIGAPTDPGATTRWRRTRRPTGHYATTRWRRTRTPTNPDATTSSSWLTSTPIDPDATTRWRRKTHSTVAGGILDITSITTPFTVKYLDDDTTTKPFIWTTSQDSLQAFLAKKLPYADPAPDQIGDLPNGPMYPVTQPLWRFEDYDDTSSKSRLVREDYKRCETQMVRCTGDTEYNQPVCVVDLTMSEDELPLYMRSKGFHSQCEVEYRNCLKRFEITGKYYADNYQEDYLQFLHYGWCKNCKLFGDTFCV